MKTLSCVVVFISLTVASQASSLFQFAACKPRLLNSETDIAVKNKEWKGEQYVNIVSKSEPKPTCVRLSRWTELDTSEQPPFIIFHQSIHYRHATGKGYARFIELYQVSTDHYVFKYLHGKDESAKVHVKWLKLIPGVLEIQYMCSDDFIFAKNSKDFVLVTTPSAVFPPTVEALTKDILHRNKFKLKDLLMVPNCNCAANQDDKPKCVYKPLTYHINK